MIVEPRVVVPWRPHSQHRDDLWAFCRRRWEARGFAPVPSPGPSDGRFNRSAAIDDALADDGWDVAVVVDADVLPVPPAQLQAAIDAARATGRVAFPFDRFVGLAPWGTRAVLAGADPEVAGALRVVANHESSTVVIPRAAWDAVGGFDRRFVGWGQDDVAFAHATRVIVGEPTRVAGSVYHLWHEPAREKRHDDPGWRANQDLGARYRATTDPDAMRRLLCEPSGPLSSRRSTPRTAGTASTA